MKKTLRMLFASMLIAAPLLSIQAYGQLLSQQNYPPSNKNVSLTESNLPIVIISTDEVLSRTDRKMGHMIVINNGVGKTNYVDTIKHAGQTIEYNQPIAIKWRGSTSFGNDESRSKKPMSIKTLKSGSTAVTDSKDKVKLLGLGKDNDWVLLAPWQDKSYVRDILTMVMAQGGSAYAPNMRYCEVIFNKTYYGIYILSERASKGSKRLDLWDYGYSDEKDADGNKIKIDDTTGDFQVEIDRPENNYTHEVEPHFESNYSPVRNNGSEISGKVITYQYKHPEESDFETSEEWNAAKQAVKTAIDQMEGSFRTSDYTSDYPNYVDINSFIDYEIAQEVSNNIDGYRLSTPMWKYSETHAKASGGNAKWKMALWDFNIAYGHNDGSYYYPSRADWRYTANDLMVSNGNNDAQLIPFYWYKLMNDDAYVQQLKERYTQRRKNSYTDARVTTICDSLKNLLNQGAAERDNSAWYNFGNLSNEISTVAKFTKDRLAWMDASWLIESTEPEDPEDPEEPITTGKAEPLAIAEGYNMDVICEDKNNIDGTVTTGDYAGIDNAHWVYYTTAVRSNGAVCKNDGIYSSDNAQYYINVTGKNALVMKNGLASGGTLTLKTPARLQKLYVAGTSSDNGNNVSNVGVTVNYKDGSTTTANFSIPDWGNSTGATVVITELGRMDLNGNLSSKNHFSIFELAISTDATKEVSSVSFNNNSSYNPAIFSLSGIYATQDFQLAGTTFWKDDSWNTLCLPFDVDDFTGTPLEGAIVKTLESSAFDNGVLTLKFNEENLDTVKAGVPYIVKWEQSDNVENPTFNDVVVKGEEQPSKTEFVDYIGSYEVISLEGGDNSVLYLGANNTLYYPAADIDINPYHAYFKLNGLTAGGNGAKSIRAINIDFNDDPQGIQTIVAPTNELIDYWYTLDGRRLDQKPTARGIYLHHGRRVMIK